MKYMSSNTLASFLFRIIYFLNLQFVLPNQPFIHFYKHLQIIYYLHITV